jgi:hypothetical protein
VKNRRQIFSFIKNWATGRDGKRVKRCLVEVRNVERQIVEI